MSYKGVLSTVYNMSLGFIPVIFAILLCQFIRVDYSLYISTALAILYSYMTLKWKGVRVPNFMLHISTLVLLSYTILSFFRLPGMVDTFPVIIEVSVLIPTLILYIFRKRFISLFQKNRKIPGRKLAIQGAESAVVSARLVLLLGILHLVILGSYFLFVKERTALGYWLVYQLGPLLVFIVCIIMNQLGIRFFNRVMSEVIYIPIVNERGNVIGRTSTADAAVYKNAYTNPVIRIAMTRYGMLYLSERTDPVIDTGKLDIPLESFLMFNETLDEGANRIMKEAFPKENGFSNPKFSIVYPFNNDETSRLIYLYIVDVKDDIIFCDEKFKGGKLWTFQQIKQNLDKNYLSQFLEYEYEHLKTVIYTREKYRES